VTDATPAMTQPSITSQRGMAFIAYSAVGAPAYATAFSMLKDPTIKHLRFPRRRSGHPRRAGRHRVPDGPHGRRRRPVAPFGSAPLPGGRLAAPQRLTRPLSGSS
jgi:hypothetical protein